MEIDPGVFTENIHENNKRLDEIYKKFEDYVTTAHQLVSDAIKTVLDVDEEEAASRDSIFDEFKDSVSVNRCLYDMYSATDLY